VSNEQTNQNSKSSFRNLEPSRRTLPTDLKGKLTHLLILEIRSYLKKKESKGNLEIFLNGDGASRKNGKY
jgi:hypothetical protein